MCKRALYYKETESGSKLMDSYMDDSNDDIITINGFNLTKQNIWGLDDLLRIKTKEDYDKTSFNNLPLLNVIVMHGTSTSCVMPNDSGMIKPNNPESWETYPNIWMGGINSAIYSFESIIDSSTSENVFVDRYIDILLQDLNEKYLLINKDQIFEFLNSQQELVKLLNDGEKTISELLNKEFEKITIEYEHDPEEGIEGIFITIYKEASIDELLEANSNIVRNWLLQLDRQLVKNTYVNVMPL